LSDAPHPGAVRKGRVIFLPHRLGEIYFTHGARLHRDLFANALGLIYDRLMVKVDLPSAGRVSLLHQPDQGRYVAHLLYATPLQRGRCLVIEDILPLANVPVVLRVPERIRKAYLVPGKRPLSLQRAGDEITVVVPSFRGHCAVAFEY
jgi:hypothetical protein